MATILTDLLDGDLFDDNLTVGTENDDTIVGDAGNDTLLGLGGDDFIEAGAGNDSVEGGTGDDILRGGPGNDTLDGGVGRDLVEETGNVDFTLTDTQLIGNGVDSLISIETAILFTGAGDNRIDASGFSGSTILRGGAGNDSLQGGSGDDLMDGGTGIDRVYESGDFDYVLKSTSNAKATLTGNGNDTLEGVEAVTIQAGDGGNIIDTSEFRGSAEIFGLDGDDVITGGRPGDYINGGAGNDLINGGAGDDSIEGGVGADILTGGGGNDFIDGGDGQDTLIEFADFAEGIILSDTQLLTDGLGDTVDTLANIESAIITLKSGGRSIRADDFTGSTSLFGERGSNLIRGGSGEDFISGERGFDTLKGNAGNDTIRGGEGNDDLDGGDGDDIIDGGVGDDRVRETGDFDQILSDTQLIGRGNDTLISIERANLRGGVSDNTIDATGFSGLTSIFGREGNDTISGGSGKDRIRGESGNDDLRGNSGNDTLEGGDGNDILRGGAGDDRFEGGAGRDRVIESGNVDFRFSASQSLLIGNGTDALLGIEELALTGGVSSNDINVAGFTGSTNLSGFFGNDTIQGGSGVDTISGGLGNDTIRGNSGDDFLTGNGGNDLLVGGSGNDILNGSDSIRKGVGEQDTLSRGSELGRNLFILGDSDSAYYLDAPSTSSATSFAHITDFSILGNLNDQIQLQGSAEDYRLDRFTLSDGGLGVGVFKKEGTLSPLDDDLVGVVQGLGVSTNTLDLENGNQFIYV